MPLTNSTCLNAKPDSKPYKLWDGGGLYIEIMPSGSKYWRLKYRFAGKEKRLAIGVYPTVSLATAREQRETAKKQLGDLVDPGALKRQRKADIVLSTNTTFELVAREWHHHRREGWSSRHADNILHRLETDVFPARDRYRK